jgi:hypothetical protein
LDHKTSHSDQFDQHPSLSHFRHSRRSIASLFLHPNIGFAASNLFDDCLDFAREASRLARSINLDPASWMRDRNLFYLRYLDSFNPLHARAKPTCRRRLGLPWLNLHYNSAESGGNCDSVDPKTAFVLPKKKSEVNLALESPRTKYN